MRTFEFAGPDGRLEGLLDEPSEPPRAAVVMAHPHPEHGGTMHTKVVCELPEPKKLVVIDAADHLFDGKTQEVGDAIEDLLSDWKGTP